MCASNTRSWLSLSTATIPNIYNISAATNIINMETTIIAFSRVRCTIHMSILILSHFFSGGTLLCQMSKTHACVLDTRIFKATTLFILNIEDKGNHKFLMEDNSWVIIKLPKLVSSSWEPFSHRLSFQSITAGLNSSHCNWVALMLELRLWKSMDKVQIQLWFFS